MHNQSESDSETEMTQNSLIAEHEQESHSSSPLEHNNNMNKSLVMDDSWTRQATETADSSSRRAPPRRVRFLWVILVGIAILGISTFVSSNVDSPTERLVYKLAFDVNAPPEPEKRVYRQQVLASSDDDELFDEPIVAEGNNSELPFPVIQADDELPAAATDSRAVDALECRESVINFVINATDAKDECNGLKKAFDMTCNSDSEFKTSADPEKRRRLFAQKQQEKTSLTLKLYQLTRHLRSIVRKKILPSDKDELFFPEDLVAGDAWEEAKFQVLNGYDAEIHESTRRRLAGEAIPRYYDPHHMRFLEASSAESEVQKANVTTVNGTTVSKPFKPKVSLSMPTNKVHASDQMLSDTLMLGKEKDIKAAMKAYSNQTNATLTAAQEDAAASAKAVHDTAAAVSAVLNDPESVEARTCCASILNVYHEHCDKTENNEISDSNLFLIVFIIAFCGVVKSLIRHFKIRWLPEAAGCILVGVLFGGVMSFIPHYDLSFDGDWFLRIMVPPIGECTRVIDARM